MFRNDLPADQVLRFLRLGGSWIAAAVTEGFTSSVFVFSSACNSSPSRVSTFLSTTQRLREPRSP